MIRFNMFSKFAENILFSIAFIIIISGCFDCGTSTKMVKKVAIFGGTGMTGVAVTEYALQKGN